MFIVLEGPEGAGKSVQSAQLADFLRGHGLRVVLTREPGGTAVGDAIRTILLQRDELPLASETEALLMTAARAQHVREVLQPALDRGDTIVCDRYVDSTYAYQGGGRQLDLDALRQLQQFATSGLVPDLRILLDLPVRVGLSRRYGGHEEINRIDRESIAFHERVREAFLALAHQDPESWQIIDATADEQQVAAKIQRVVAARLGLAATP